MTVARPAAVALMAILLTGTHGCGDSSLRRIPPLPSLANVEPAVAARIQSVHATLSAEPTVAHWVAYARALHAHDMPEAAAAYEIAAENAPEAERFQLLHLAAHNCFKRDPDRATLLLERAAAIRNDYLPLHLRLGAIHEKALRHDEARRHYERAQALSPSSLALVGLGRIALAAGRGDEAIALLEKARAMTPDHAEVHVALAQAYARAGRKQDALRATALAGDVERERGFEDELVSGVARESVSVCGLEQYGSALLRGKQFDQAIAAFDKALAVQPDNLGVVLLRAQALVATGRTAEAEPALDRVLASTPDNSSALAFRGGCAMARGDLPTAVSYLRRAIAADPSLADARWNLARALTGLGQQGEAKKHMATVLEARPHRVDVRLQLAEILAAESDIDVAMTHVERVLVDDPKNPRALALRQQLTNR